MKERRPRGGILAAWTIAASVLLTMGGGGSALASSPLIAQNSTVGSPTPTPSPTQSTTYKTVPEEFSIMVSPTRLVIGPGEMSEHHTVTVVNRGESPVHVDVKVQSFVGAPDGSLTFQDDAPYSAIEWVTIQPGSFDLQPGTAQEVTAAVVMPQDADLGDHQVALIFLVPAGETAANIKINRGIATPVYITVPGITDDSAQVTELAAPAFSGGGPIAVTALVHNVGTVHRDFRGATALAISGAETTFPDFTVPRGGDRDISAQWQPPFLCVCELTVSIVNADSVSTSAVVRVVVFPVIPAILIVGGLLLVVLLVLARRQYRKGVRQETAELSAFARSGDV